MFKANQFHNKECIGFTLAELLISLAILGVIATFTIPKVMVSQRNTAYNAKLKEAIATVSDAYTAYRKDNVPSATTYGYHLTPYMNYVSIDTAGVVDVVRGYTGTWSCVTNGMCLKLHNGAVLQPAGWFNGTASTDSIPFIFDPDGVLTDSVNTDSPGKAIRLFLYMNGRVVTAGTCTPNTYQSGTLFGGPYPNMDPTWLSWN